MILSIELVPKTAWFNNLRSYLSKTEWDEVRKRCYSRANHKCEICGGKGPKWPVECHEIWEYKNNQVSLVDLISLCPDCHEVKHIGLAQIKGNFERALNHFIKVNRCSKQEALSHIENAFGVWRERNKTIWQLNVDYLKTYLNE